MFDSATQLLQHFAAHVNLDNDEIVIKKCSIKKIPELHPIKNNKEKKHAKHERNLNSSETEEKSIEDPAVNPMKFCEVTMEETKEQVPILSSSDVKKPKNALRKYECSFCSRNFGWSTDLKRHILTHTGERPFVCKLCDATFTRNFLLQKHVLKQHSNKVIYDKSKIPPLKPISMIFRQKSRKQDKFNIKRKLDTKSLYQMDQSYQNLLCSS